MDHRKGIDWKKKVTISLFACFILLILGTVFYKYRKSYHWNYTGNAVVLAADSSHEYIETTNIILDGKLYNFEKTFLGDLRIGTIEAKKQFYGEQGLKKGMMTMYRYNLEKNGEEYFKDKEIREKSLFRKINIVSCPVRKQYAVR